jgi:hypothetical protein
MQPADLGTDLLWINTVPCTAGHHDTGHNSTQCYSNLQAILLTRLTH